MFTTEPDVAIPYEGAAFGVLSGLFVGEDFTATGLLQRLQLHVGVLVDGRYAGIPVFHGD